MIDTSPEALTPSPSPIDGRGGVGLSPVEAERVNVFVIRTSHLALPLVGLVKIIGQNHQSLGVNNAIASMFAARKLGHSYESYPERDAGVYATAS